MRVIDGTPRETRFVSPSAYLHYMRSCIALDRGQTREAEHQLEQALLFDPTSPHLLTRLAELKRRAEKLDLALTLVDRALEASPGYPEAIRLRAKVLQQLARPGAGQRVQTVAK